MSLSFKRVFRNLHYQAHLLMIIFVCFLIYGLGFFLLNTFIPRNLS